MACGSGRPGAYMVPPAQSRYSCISIFLTVPLATGNPHSHFPGERSSNLLSLDSILHFQFLKPRHMVQRAWFDFISKPLWIKYEMNLCFSRATALLCILVAAVSACRWVATTFGLFLLRTVNVLLMNRPHKAFVIIRAQVLLPLERLFKKHNQTRSQISWESVALT